MSHSWVSESNRRIFKMTHLGWEWAQGFKNQFLGTGTILQDSLSAFLSL